MFFQIGTTLHHSFGFDSESEEHFVTDSNQQRFKLLSLQLNSNNNGKPWFSYNAAIGKQWALANNNFFRVGLVADISFVNVVSGNYLDLLNSAPSYGTYKKRGSAIAVQITYFFTGTKKTGDYTGKNILR